MDFSLGTFSKSDNMWHVKRYIEDLIYEDETLTYGQKSNVNETINANKELIIKALNEIADKIKEQL